MAHRVTAGTVIRKRAEGLDNGIERLILGYGDAGPMAGKKPERLFCPICEVEVRPSTFDGLTKHILHMHPDLWQILEQRPSQPQKASVPYVR